ncbi:MAG: transcriptional regulator [Gammaproteobacteria bacterium CG11_big_fil_rev_8_21_14_0_20_46_22]|nr:MAG: transcriptional regulator [Gammaproteobacteria bacterium CG11_big_fil_rev_8_21_14_0_20_46_22]
MNKRKELVAIGKNIRHLRKEQGYSQEGFAAFVNISRAFYGRIERGEHNVSAMNLIKIAKSLNIEVGCLFPNLSELKKIK